MTKTQVRAHYIERKIRREMASGRFVLGGGYLHATLGKPCEGCAISAAAFCLSKKLDPVHFRQTDGNADGAGEFREIRKTGRMTPTDIAQLELGYEAWPYLKRGKRYYTPRRNHPFFLLGKKLSLKVNHRPRQCYFIQKNEVQA